MLRSARDLRGYLVQASDGHIGTVFDLYLDNKDWVVRYVVVDIGMLLPGRKVLVSCAAVQNPGRTILPVSITRDQVRTSPDIEPRPLLSRRHQLALHRHYRWPVYWASMAGPMVGPSPEESMAEESAPQAPEFATGLCSMEEVAGYAISAYDGRIGHVADFIVDTDSWMIRYLVVDTRNWLPARKVLISPDWIEEIAWQREEVVLDVSREKVKNAPQFDPGEAVNRAVEERLYDYYGRPRYWDQPSVAHHV